MVFNSLAFALFLPVVLLFYHCSNGERKIWVLLLAGYVFYGAWDPRFLFLVSVSTALDFCTGLMIGNGRMTGRQRAAASLYVSGFALVFLVPDWHALTFDADLSAPAGPLSLPGFSRFGVWVFCLTLMVVWLVVHR